MTTNTTAKWLVDTGHSEVHFTVKHLQIANVSGNFKLFKGDVETNSDDFNNAKVNCVIDVKSIDTNNAIRDGHLKSDTFFDAGNFPEMIFDGHIKKQGDNYELVGTLTIHGTTQPITMRAEYFGSGMGRHNDTRAGFAVSGKINRKEFGLSFNIITDTGALVIGEEIKLNFNIELILQA
jgi:polyisoprenoid-binding protein YceI